MRRMLGFLIVALMASPAVGAYANELPPGDYGAGSNTTWVNRPIFNGGDPTSGKFTGCHVRIKGPYHENGNDKVVVGQGRLECLDESDLYLSDMRLRVRNATKGYGLDREDSCGYAGDDITMRKDANGVHWWGCSFTRRVEDKAPVTLENWYVSFYGEINQADPNDSGPLSYSSVISYCKNHANWCADHPSKVAIREGFH